MLLTGSRAFGLLPACSWNSVVACSAVAPCSVLSYELARVARSTSQQLQRPDARADWLVMAFQKRLGLLPTYCTPSCSQVTG
jgi:hypothetical protein